MCTYQDNLSQTDQEFLLFCMDFLYLDQCLSFLSRRNLLLVERKRKNLLVNFNNPCLNKSLI